MLTCRIVLQTAEPGSNRRVEAMASMLDRVKVHLKYHKLKGGMPRSDVLSAQSEMGYITRAILTFSDEERVPDGYEQRTLEDTAAVGDGPTGRGLG
jgi:hypothetical protein